MPKLSKEKAAAVNESEGQSYELMPEGRYIGELIEVKGDGKGPAGPYWTWVFATVPVEGTEGENFAGRRHYLVTSLSQDWAVKAAFEAFGVDADTDTDELITQCVAITVSQSEIEKGPKKGQLSNNVDAINPIGDDETDAIADAGGDEDEDVF